MYVERILYPVYTLGIGSRIAIWVSGCNKKCPNCANPELWEQQPSQKIEEPHLYKILQEIIDKNQVDGITISGGEPFDQKEDLYELVTHIKQKNKQMEILCYTGYEKEQIEQDQINKKILQKIDILIDGKYIDEKNDNKIPLRGSTNQKIYYLTPNKQKEYEKYMKENGRKVQNVYYKNSVVSIGIHNIPKKST